MLNDTGPVHIHEGCGLARIDAQEGAHLPTFAQADRGSRARGGFEFTRVRNGLTACTFGAGWVLRGNGSGLAVIQKRQLAKAILDGVRVPGRGAARAQDGSQERSRGWKAKATLSLSLFYC